MVFICAASFTGAQKQATTPGSAIDGFTAREAAVERNLEERFRRIPTATSARAHLQRLTGEPHVAGTPEDYQTALYIQGKLREFGITAELKEYQVLLPYPKQPSLVELIKPNQSRKRLLVEEAVVSEDATSASRKIIPLFNGYSASGDVTAPLVYVNYGLPSDYEALKKINVELRGRIVVARYGRSFRGVKAKVAEQNGAAGLIIYSDPADDGYTRRHIPGGAVAL